MVIMDDKNGKVIDVIKVITALALHILSMYFVIYLQGKASSIFRLLLLECVIL